MRPLLCLATAFAVTAPAVTATPALAGQDPAMVGAANRAEMYGSAMRARRNDYVATQQRNDVRNRETAQAREALAERLATMANNGECRRAIAIARREGETQIADRLGRMCRLSN